jgi:hypothetical protein
MHCNNHIFWHADLTCSYLPPKKARAAARRHGVRNGFTEKEVKRVDSGNLGKDSEPLVVVDKRIRRAIPEEAEQAEEAYKAPTPRESTTPSKYFAGSPRALSRSYLAATPVQVLKFLLSDAALEFCLPPDEFTALQEHNGNLKTYSNLLTPFEELLCAVILSRPISHRIGFRIIRTMLNAPYEFHNPVAIKTAGHRKVLEALGVARTQHKETTVGEIESLAEIVSSNNWHNDLSKLRSSCKNEVESEREVLRRSIKGLGRNGLDTFYRRVQWQWDEAYPFVDARTQSTLERLGLPRRAEGIAKMIEVRWGELGFEQGIEEYGMEEKRKRAFVVLLERVAWADLEGRIVEVVEEAAKL